MKHNDDLVAFIILCGLIISGISFAVGLINGGSNDKNYSCTGESIAVRLNIPYFVGCEFTKPRFKNE